LRQPLADLLAEQDSDIVFYTTAAKQVLATAQRDPAISNSAFQAAAAPAIQRALAGHAAVDTVFVGDSLYHVISIPVKVAEESIGALTLGLEIGNAEAKKFSQLTRSQIALLAGGRVVASTLSGAGANAEIADIYGTLRTDETPTGPPHIEPV